MNFIIVLMLLGFPENSPPGTVRIKDFYVDKTEVQNVAYMEYLHFKSLELDSLAMLSLLPDTANFWFRSADKRTEPIVYISQRQAIDYCIWRSEVVSRMQGKSIRYRLPTADEWATIAEAVLETELKANTKALAKAKRKVAKNRDALVLFTRDKDPSSVVDLFTNVSEMTSVDGIAMGANNNELKPLHANLTGIIQYDAPHAMLGFRCIVEVEE